jgi:hypothetical protein
VSAPAQKQPRPAEPQQQQLKRTSEASGAPAPLFFCRALQSTFDQGGRSSPESENGAN